MAEIFFDIAYEFDKALVDNTIREIVDRRESAYICVADGVTLATSYESSELKKVLAGARITICDSSWVPTYLKFLYGINRETYTGSELFYNTIRCKKYKMMFLGSNKEILDALRQSLSEIDPNISDMKFVELPFCKVENFNYPQIAEMIKQESPEIIWVSLGMPKQEFFMSRLRDHLNQGLQIGVGAAFKFYSGKNELKRAPLWMRKIRLEWLFRIFQEPQKQIKRCLLIAKNMPPIIIKEYKIKTRKNGQQ
ncbi:LPS biosynthesis protein [Bacteroidales bacterium]|nr:LPS biosynthesis protein [Bacteroidales bacterium]